MIEQGYKIRIYPTKEQKRFFAKTFGCSRLIYNKGLSFRISEHKAGRPSNYFATNKYLTCLKSLPEYEFLREVDSIALQQALRHLDNAYKRFFKMKKGYPNYKNKHSKQSYTTNNVSFVGGYLKLPKVGYVKTKQAVPYGRITSATVELSPSGKYYVSLHLADVTPKKVPKAINPSIGLDLGIKDFVITSAGDKYDFDRKEIARINRKLRREQKKLSRKLEKNIIKRCKDGSRRYKKKLKDCKNYQKQKAKLAMLHEQLTNKRTDFLQKLSTQIVIENQVVCVETLKVKNMMKNHKLAKHIQTAGWSEFVEMLDYKCNWYKRTLVKIDTFYPSSQLCSVCGVKNLAVKDLKIRKWTCPCCGATLDRDINASKNIEAEGLRILMA